MDDFTPRLRFDATGIDLDAAMGELSAIVRHAADETTGAGKMGIVERSPYGYRAGMTTEVRIAPKWGNAVSDYIRHLRAKDRSPGTVYIRSYQLRVFSQAFRGRSPWTLTDGDIEAFLVSIDHLSRSTKRSMLTAIRGFYRYGVQHRMIDANPCEYIDPIKFIHGVPRPAADADIREALDAADDRAKMMIFLGAFCGLRRSEIARVHTDDLKPWAGGKYRLRVVGKGLKVRHVPLTPFMVSMIESAPHGFLFPSWHRGQIGADGKVYDEPLSPGRCGEIMRDALPKGVTPHMLRHRFASTVYAANRDIRATQELLGHSSVATTQTYTAVPADSMQTGVDAAGMLAT